MDGAAFAEKVVGGEGVIYDVLLNRNQILTCYPITIGLLWFEPQ